ncbi:phosphoesterase PA-phosphatase related [Kineococcus radiotolerans SRS30216 = ATCC BAA-149]|uniref:Phosphoesterase PA-phosphatase related n=1 Tax=Kineococcus radiotolerans (strain ATCC BAA-149 / DSM 14245 / SRS30216) TaxID=266940 RepID=A6W4L1_KINRD|nr:phosphoesterase PA-phosphatase related [Kineococcus radiotolerans SRS30216 = ATCC BAA-149]
MPHSGGVVTSAPSQQHRPSRTRGARRTWSPAALGSAWGLTLALAVLYCVCVRTATGQRHENRLHAEALEARGTLTGWAARAFGLVERLEPQHLLLGALAVAVLGLLRGRPGKAAQGLVVAAGTLGLTEVLKLVLLERPELAQTYGATANSLPSGHTSAVLGLALGVLVAAPRWLRPPLALAGAVAAGAMGAFVVADGWHRVSDVLASALVGALVLCLVQVLPGRDERRRGRLLALALVVPAASAVALVVVYAGGAPLPVSYLAAGAVVALTVLAGARALPREVGRGR